MTTKSCHAIPFPTSAASERPFPWQRCHNASLAERYYDLSSAIASAIPRGEHRLRDALRTVSVRLRRAIACAASEPTARRYHRLIQDAARACNEAALWIHECEKRAYGLATDHAEARSLLALLLRRLRELNIPNLAPYPERCGADLVPPTLPSTIASTSDVPLADPTNAPDTTTSSSTHSRVARAASFATSRPSRLPRRATSSRRPHFQRGAAPSARSHQLPAIAAPAPPWKHAADRLPHFYPE